MQTSLLAYAVPKAQVERSRQERLASDEKVDMLRQQLAADVGLAWPPPRCTAGPGRPSRQSKWVQALYSRIEDPSLPPERAASGSAVVVWRIKHHDRGGCSRACPAGGFAEQL